MSADEFDPAIERLFAQAPRMADADLFAVEVETRLASRSRIRGVVLALAGLAGGAVAVRETLSVNLEHAEALLTGRALGQGSQAALAAAQSDVQSTLDRLGLAGISLGSLGAMQLFWITAAALVALTAAAAVKLSQEA
ncbi:MAG: hypothetical protein KF910_02300 [Brevundimonas sp.]|uniref:hypothetical protein n=1 Tax=Brevundimonas sp. TaxID=1871086 RepID=UPI0025BCFBD6|nr:hypothetical protein [Brevundimonas sp.]MBX3476415.1 hypothetical protein [Brevundimonas sp.]